MEDPCLQSQQDKLGVRASTTAGDETQCEDRGVQKQSTRRAELSRYDFRLIQIVDFSRSRDTLHVLTYKTSILNNLLLFPWLTEDDQRFLISLVSSE